MAELPQPTPPALPVVLPPLTDLPPAAAALVPAVNANLDLLAALPPGPEAQEAKTNTGVIIGQIIQAVQAAAANPQIDAAAQGVLAQLPAKWQFWVATAGGLALALLGAFSTGRYVLPSNPADPPAKVAPLPDVVVPKAAVTAPRRLIIYPVTSQDTAAILAEPTLKAMPLGIKVEAANPPGSHLPWKGKQIPLPCAALLSDDGHVLDVAPFTSGVDLAAWAGKK